MKVILFMAQSINGIIARKNNQEDFLSDENWQSFLNLTKKTKCFITGRKTYEQVKKLKDYNFDNINATKIIVSHNKHLPLNKSYILATSPQDALKQASQLGFKEVLLTGGGNLNTSFIKNKLIDEIIINIEPYILGQGITLFSKNKFENKLRLLNIKQLKDGIIQLHYKLIK